MKGLDNGVRSTKHYIVFRIGADTDIYNGRIRLVEKTLKKMEEREDYIACQALYDALQYHASTRSKVAPKEKENQTETAA